MASAEFISESISFDTVSMMTRPEMCRFCSQDLVMDCVADHSGKPCLIGTRYSSIGTKTSGPASICRSSFMGFSFSGVVPRDGDLRGQYCFQIRLRMARGSSSCLHTGNQGYLVCR
jgi:hypothetical protein